MNRNIVILFNKLFLSLLCISVYAQDSNSYNQLANVESIRGLVKPSKKAVLSSEIAGRITDIKFSAGEKFNKGDVLVKFDCALYQAELSSANAKLKAEEKRYTNNKKLLALNAISDIDVQLSKAEMEMAKADARVKNIITTHCSIRAPYSGRVIDVMVNEYESVLADQELLSILNDKELEIDLIVPSFWLARLSRNEKFTFSVDETAKEYAAKVLHIGAVVDPVSQTIRLTGKFEGAVEDVLSGMSGSAIFK